MDVFFMLESTQGKFNEYRFRISIQIQTFIIMFRLNQSCSQVYPISQQTNNDHIIMIPQLGLHRNQLYNQIKMAFGRFHLTFKTTAGSYNFKQQMQSELNLAIDQLHIETVQTKHDELTMIEYVYPMLAQGEKFSSLENIRDTLFSQAYNIECQEIYQMLQEKRSTSADNCNHIQFVCKNCKVRLNFIPNENGGFTLGQFDNVHSHNSLMLSDQERRWIAEVRQSTQLPIKCPTVDTNEHPEYDPINKFEVQVVDLDTPPSVEIQEPITFNQMSKLSQNVNPGTQKQTVLQRIQLEEAKQKLLSIEAFKKGLNSLVERGSTTYLKRGRNPEFPSFMVVVSHSMKKKFQQFGDILSINTTPITWDVCGVSYKLTLFSVFGASRKSLPAGFLIHQNYDQATFLHGLKLLFKIHKKRPKVFISDYNPIIYRTLQIFQELGTNLIHLLDPQQFFHEARTILGCQKLDSTTQARLNKIIEDVSEENVNNQLEKLILSGKQNLKRLGDYVLSVKENICRSALPNNFVGMPLSSKKDIQEVIEKINPPQNFGQFLDIFKNIDETLDKNCCYRISQYEESIELIFDDPLIQQVRQGVESSIFEIFMRSYIKQSDEVGLVKIYDLNQEQLEEEDKDKGLNLTIFFVDLKEKKCTCNYPTKIGLPCSHMISVARSQESSYKALIHRRWKSGIIQKKARFSSDSIPHLTKLDTKK